MNQKNIPILNSNFWNTRYINNNFTWDIGKSTPIFEEWSRTIQNKKNIKICIPGCGRGHDVIYLSREGFDVYAFDFSKEAISYLKKKNNKHKLNTSIYCMDFFDIDKKYNLFFDYILEYTFYCAINPKYRMNYVSKCYDLLSNNGKLISIMLPLSQADNKIGPPFLVSKKELIKKFENKFTILKMEKSNLSIPKRRDIELYVEYEKKKNI